MNKYDMTNRDKAKDRLGRASFDAVAIVYALLDIADAIRESTKNTYDVEVEMDEPYSDHGEF